MEIDLERYCGIKKHHTPLHELMYKFKLKPDLMEKISAIRQGPKWEPDVAIRIAENIEKAKNEDLGRQIMNQSLYRT